MFAFIVGAILSKYKTYPGEINLSSNSMTELIELHMIGAEPAFKEIGASSCKWYYQTSYGFYACVNGEIVLDDNSYNTIVTKHIWHPFTYPTVISDDDFDKFLYGSKIMIYEDLKTKTLFICDRDDGLFSNNGLKTFLDKNSKTLYFCCFTD